MTIRLRPFRTEDAAGVRAIYAPFVHDTAVTFEDDLPPVEAFVERAQDGPATWLVACTGDRVIGYAYAGTHRTRCAYRFSVETSVYLDEQARGRGVAKALYGALFEILHEQGYVTAFAGVALPNEASVRLHEGMGFFRVGVHKKTGLKHGAWHDVVWMEKILDEDAATERTDPRPMPQLDPDWVLSVCARYESTIRDAPPRTNGVRKNSKTASLRTSPTAKSG